MSSNAHFDFSFEDFQEQNLQRRGLWLISRFCDISHFFLRLRVQLRHGRLSRAPLKLLRMEILPNQVALECLARNYTPPEQAASDRMARRHITLQVLRDAIDLRAILFHSVPDVDTAHIRIYGDCGAQKHELILIGLTHRNDQTARGVHSLILRAKILGFHFRLHDDLLKAMAEDMYAPFL